MNCFHMYEEYYGNYMHDIAPGARFIFSVKALNTNYNYKYAHVELVTHLNI